MAGFKDFVDQVELTAAEVDEYLMKQTAMRFGTTALLVAALPVGVAVKGMLAWADDVEVLYLYDGTNWVPWYSTEKTASVIITAGGTNITFGNSTVSQKWRYSGGMVKFVYTFTQGSTANMQAGNLAMSLPIAVHADQLFHPLGQVGLYDSSAPSMFVRHAVTLGVASSVGFVTEGAVRATPASPYVMAVGDVITLNLHYRPADSVKL